MQRLAAPSWGLPEGYVEQVPPAYYCDDVPAIRGVTWQPDVYPFAADLARLGGVSVIVDIGCGHADKLALVHDREPGWLFVGVDYDSNLAWCREHYGWGQWLDRDLELGLRAAGLLAGSVVVVADVVEHLVDPRPLLRDVAAGEPAVVVLSTPARELIYPPGHLGPPGNACHVREWSGLELEVLVESCGLRVVERALTRADDLTGAMETTMLVAVPA